MDSCPCPYLHVFKISKFVSTDHGTLLFGTAFCNGRYIRYIAISSSCTLAVLELHASLRQRTFTHFIVRRCFREHCYLFAGDSSRGGGSSMAQSGQTYITGLGVIDHCDHIVDFILIL